MSDLRRIVKALVRANYGAPGSASLAVLERRASYGGKKGRRAARRLALLERAGIIPEAHSRALFDFFQWALDVSGVRASIDRLVEKRFHHEQSRWN